ncbi:hypothetical protein [Thalassotalea sp. SU-HH00458]|uniref:hypothetical protein n=1 Tax=Thalassotalea sp. SU-HH00458 TaxID=3127657 RepID=UPI003104159D
MKNILIVAVIAFTSLSCFANNDDIFVAPNGVDSKKQLGSIRSPYKTVSYALKNALAGTNIWLRGGEYQEQVKVSGIKGSKEHPVVISAYQNEKVIFDGTDDLKLSWQPYEKGIFKAKVNQDVWQLFVDNEQMMPARWPNARFDTGSVYSEDVWSKALVKPSSNGHLVDDPSKHDLAVSGLNIEGALVIANTGSYTTWTRKVTQHEKGADNFKHTKTPSIKSKHFNYYLEGKLDFLDEQTEWFYHKEQQSLYLKPKQKDISNLPVKGKVRAFSFDVKKWQHVVIKNIDFFAAPIQCVNCAYVTLENVNFEYAGVSRRMLGEEATPADMIRLSSGKKGKGHFIVRNCRITDTDSQAIVVHGNYSIVENCHFENTDYAVTEAHRPGSDIALSGIGVQYRFNTNINSGNSATLALSSPKIIKGKRPYNTLIAEFNDMSKTGFAQTDGSMIQGHIPMQNGVIIRYNWFHDSSKLALRFDAPIPAVRWGKFGLVHHNVLWNTAGMMIKGTDHRIYQNLAFDNDGSDIIILKDKVTKKQLQKKKFKPGTIFGGGNKRTITKNNIADSISGHRKKPAAVPGILGKNIDGHLTKQAIEDLLVDADNRDFRVKNAKDIVAADKLDDTDIKWLYPKEEAYAGVYPANINYYWIPGQRLVKTSHPIPANGSVIKSNRVDLMWREAYGAVKHRVYLATDKDVLLAQNPNEKWFVAEKVKSNIHPININKTDRYYWRVDALVNDKWIKGDVWQLLPESDG